MKYRRKETFYVDAKKFETNNDDGSHLDELVAWVEEVSAGYSTAHHNGTDLFVYARRGKLCVSQGHWLIRCADGSFMTMSNKRFNTYFEEVPND